ncbi:hypothetical protein CVT25_010452 [Psilocybe cyanescens]|uniref:Transmembrane protein n=1 Tax=Psilocybe cyanescens TaxID=93625 RepID=A0A409XQA2_PSICY|nr:hypothetical protein CVT25_010452 [Psilocybe cyanescens]
MSTPDIPFPVNVQENQIRANLNSSMLLNFLMVSKKPVNSNHCIVLSAISVLYCLCFLYFAVQWYYLDWVLVVNGDTRESIFLATVVDGLDWIWVLCGFLANSMFIISDGLLIWRCYHVWGQSFWAILAPLIPLVAECGLSVATTVFSAKFSSATSDANFILFNNISSALIFVSLGTTVIVTFIIGYRLHSASRIHHLSSRRLYNHIVTIIIESAAAYSLVLLFEAITVVVPSGAVIGSSLQYSSYYMDGILTAVSNQGMAPTVLVARIALTDPNSTDAPATLTHISGDLQFGSQQGSGSGRSGDTTGGDINTSVYANEVDQTLVIEVKRQFSADATCGDNQV